MLGPAGKERLQGSRGERRLNALNPHGNIDFMLPSAGMSEYLGETPNIPILVPPRPLRHTSDIETKSTVSPFADALTSHGAYWSDPSFGAFMLAGEPPSACKLLVFAVPTPY